MNEKEFLFLYKEYQGSKENSPIAYELLKKLKSNMNYFAYMEYEWEKMSKLKPGLSLINSAFCYSLIYIPFYYYRSEGAYSGGNDP